MKNVLDDIQDFISGKINKEEFKTALENGLNTASCEDSYDKEELRGIISGYLRKNERFYNRFGGHNNIRLVENQNAMKLRDTLSQATPEQITGFIEALDEVIYASQDSSNKSKKQADSVIFEGRRVCLTQSALLATELMNVLVSVMPKTKVDREVVLGFSISDLRGGLGKSLLYTDAVKEFYKDRINKEVYRKAGGNMGGAFDNEKDNIINCIDEQKSRERKRLRAMKHRLECLEECRKQTPGIQKGIARTESGGYTYVASGAKEEVKKPAWLRKRKRGCMGE